MFRNTKGFTLLELLIVVSLIGISVALAVPSWENVTQKRRITNATEQVAAFLAVAQSDAQKRNLPVSLSFDRTGDQSWCAGTSLGTNACDCTETDVTSAQYCAIEGNPNRVQSNDFQFINLVEAIDTQPAGGSSHITFDPIRGILQPAGDSLRLTFESRHGVFRLRLSIGPTGLLMICSPEADKQVAGYAPCLS